MFCWVVYCSFLFKDNTKVTGILEMKNFHMILFVKCQEGDNITKSGSWSADYSSQK